MGYFGIIGTNLIKFNDAENLDLNMSIDIEFWTLSILKRGTYTWSVVLNNTSYRIELIFRDPVAYDKWLKKLKRFTVQRDIKNDLNITRILGTGASAKVYLA